MTFRDILKSLPDRLERRPIALLMLLVAGWFGAVIAAVVLFVIVVPQPDLQPQQPIEFPHYVHALKLGMECAECHPHAEQSIHAGLPDTAACMECHEAAATESPEIIKLTALHESGQPIKWARVYFYKDFVYFTHKRHVLSGVKCQECHGPVELMTTIQRAPTIGMGWCVNCHRDREAPMECNTCHQ
jgi:hypothetical protein